MLTHILLVPLIACTAAAQTPIWNPPRVSIERLSRDTHSRVPPDEVAAGDVAAFSARLEQLQSQGGVQRQDLAILRLETRGQWFLPVEEVAKEEAAKMGANFLVLESSSGREEYPGAIRSYRAVRLQAYGGMAVYTRPREAVEGPSRGGSSPAAPVFQPLKAPKRLEPARRETAFSWLWINQGFILSHRFQVDLERIASPAWKNLEHTVLERFPEEDRKALARCFHQGAAINIDLKRVRLWPSC